MNVFEYLRYAETLRWGYGGLDGRQDCTTFAADWIKELTGRDPAEHYRGTYNDQAGASKVLEEGGGIFNFGENLLYFDFRRQMFGKPADGDVGIIRVETGFNAQVPPVTRHIPAVFAGGLWYARALRGLRAGQFNHTFFWRYTNGL